MSIPLAVIGACGKMGKNISRLAAEGGIFNLTGAIESSDFQGCGQSYFSFSGIGSADLKVLPNLKEMKSPPAVVIDFSYFKATLKHLADAAELKIPYVIGTTGFSESQVEEIRQYSKKIPVLLSPNMSMGVNVLFLAAEYLTRLIGENYDIEIIEFHHNQKVDSPSGTALKLHDVVKKSLTRETEMVHGRNGLVGKRKKTEIGMHAVRAGDIVGEHTLLFAGMGEEIRLTHRALTRETFAKGALKCAEFLYNKPAGMYDMKSVLGIA